MAFWGAVSGLLFLLSKGKKRCVPVHSPAGREKELPRRDLLKMFLELCCSLWCSKGPGWSPTQDHSTAGPGSPAAAKQALAHVRHQLKLAPSRALLPGLRWEHPLAGSEPSQPSDIIQPDHAVDFNSLY